MLEEWLYHLYWNWKSTKCTQMRLRQRIYLPGWREGYICKPVCFFLLNLVNSLHLHYNYSSSPSYLSSASNDMPVWCSSLKNEKSDISKLVQPVDLLRTGLLCRLHRLLALHVFIGIQTWLDESEYATLSLFGFFKCQSSVVWVGPWSG